MLQYLYRRILKKLSLTSEQLKELERLLTPANICAHSFVRGDQLCPNTIALQIKTNSDMKQKNKQQIKKMLNSFGVTKLDLALFYLVYDLPAIISNRFHAYAISAMRKVAKTI